MKRSSQDRALAAAVALVLALGMSLWPVHGGTMATTIAADAAQAGSDHCPGCEAWDAAGARLGMCQMMCGATTLPVALATSPPATAETGFRHDALPLLGQISGLDPGPPKHPHLSDA